MDDVRAQQIADDLRTDGYDLTADEVKTELNLAFETIRAGLLAKGYRNVPQSEDGLRDLIRRARTHEGGDA